MPKTGTNGKIPRVIPSVPGSIANPSAIAGIAGKKVSTATGFNDETPAINVTKKIFFTGYRRLLLRVTTVAVIAVRIPHIAIAAPIGIAVPSESIDKKADTTAAIEF